MISGQSLTCPKGASLTFEIDMDTGSDLTGATAQWALCESWFDQAKVYLTKTGAGDGLFIGQDAGVWKITVNLAPTDTLDIPSGLLYHDCKVLLQSGDVEDVANGPFGLDPSVNILDTNAPITRNLHAVQLLGRLGQNTPLTVSWLARNLLATQSLFGLGQSAAGTVTSGGASPDFQTDFTALTSLPSWMSFSRASNAMVTYSTGDLTYAPNNLLLQSDNFSDAVWTKTNATVSRGIADPLGGTNAVTITATGANAEVFQSIASPPPGNYISAIWVRRRTGTGNVSLYTPKTDTLVVLSTTSTWTLFSTNGSITTGNGFSDFLIATSGDAIDVYAATLSQVTYETTPRTADQVITTSAPYYGPRFGHAWNGSTWIATGLMDEEQRTNLTLQSLNMQNAAWSIQAAARGTDGTLLPDGVTLACKMTAAAGNAQHAIYSTSAIAITSGAAYTHSWIVKQGTHPYIIVEAVGGAADVAIAAVFDLSNSSAAAASQTLTRGGGSSITSTAAIRLGNEYWLLVMSGTLSDTSCYSELGFAGAATGNTVGAFGNISFTAAGTETFYYGMPQAEAGSFVTSRIPTTTAAVTRSADIVQLTGAALAALQASAGSLFAELQTMTSGNNLIGSCIVGYQNPATPLYIGSETTVRSYDGAANPTASLGSGGFSSIARVGFAWDAGGFSIAGNGSTATATTPAFAVSPARADLGSNEGGSGFANAWCRSIAIYTSRLSDADLQTKSVVGVAF